ARIAGVAKLGPLADRADAHLDAARALGLGAGPAGFGEQVSGAGVGHAVPPPGRRRPAPLGLGSGPPPGLLTSFAALAARGLRASFCACTSPGLPAPVSAGVSVVLGVSPGVLTFCGWEEVGAAARVGAPACRAAPSRRRGAHIRGLPKASGS